MNVPSDQERHGDLSASASRFVPGGPEAANPADDSDTDIVVLKQYLEDLGTQAAAQDRSSLADACQVAIDGTGPPGLKERAARTIAWQEGQMRRVNGLLPIYAFALLADVLACDELLRPSHFNLDEIVPVIITYLNNVRVM
ncbi:hypothetical protein ASPWEDRAFT_731584 [Aspergillus wentii DTO 134E9]|uniref:Uncharacterized protein n=1 Tax=Aspergillus wentii DTO 134E9 TaxID=1073089 RepID=A0A1L9S1C7_ASPWE|nr:uncharacterized protein ASPWEDRAFT_731584 [Aspergillus wentii DTO 134E9]OJJ40938.1 hypothetical protein ASPWEDRAFT_731584 [Aspergillus wentii DTO 134E9]